MSYLKRNWILQENHYDVKNESNDFISNKNEKLRETKCFPYKYDMSNCGPYDVTNQSYKIGPYVIDKVIGRGNFSVVKLALHIPTQMQVAIKILNKSKMNTETLAKTYREVQIMKQIRHSNIVQLYQVIESPNWLFIIMEYVSHGELFDYLSQIGRLTENEARIKFQQILEAVDYCHKMNIVHRDLKAENLLIDGNFNIKLADFGFGSFFNDSYLLSTWCGSPPYAAPELFRGEPYIGPKADIWSLGVVLYAMVCGALPFNEQHNIAKLREQVLSGWVRFPYFISYECEHLIRMILNRNPSKRPSISNIQSHKWMKLAHENSSAVVDASSVTELNYCQDPVPRRSSRRCNTQGDDSGFDEPIDFPISNSDKISSSMKCNNSVCDVNENVLQAMERYGFSRDSVIDDLNRNTYGPSTATYLLLCAKTRIPHQSYPPLKNGDYNIPMGFIASPPPRTKFVATNDTLPSTFHTTDVQNINTVLGNILIGDPNKNCISERTSPYDNYKVVVNNDTSKMFPMYKHRNNTVEDPLNQEMVNNQITIGPTDTIASDNTIRYNARIDNGLSEYNSSTAKKEYYCRTTHKSESRHPSSYSPYSEGMGTVRTSVNVTTVPSTLSDQRSPVLCDQVYAMSRYPVDNHVPHNFSVDSQNKQYASALCHMSPLYKVPLNYEVSHHSSPLRTIGLNNQCLKEKKFFEFSRSHFLRDQTIPKCPTVMSPSAKIVYTSDSLFHNENTNVKELRVEVSPCEVQRQSYISENKCQMMPRWNEYDSSILPTNDDSSSHSSRHNTAMAPTSHTNHRTVKPSLSSGTKSPFSFYTEMPQLAPVEMNFIRFS